jgi:beta-lactamase regulating signal transducer with metallopeptidase domain
MNDAFARALIAIGSSTEVSILVKATLIMMVGLAATQVAARARASVRHMLLASAFGAVLLLPIALMLVPAAAIPIFVNVVPGASAVQPSAPRPSALVSAGDTSDQSLITDRSDVATPSLSTVLRVAWATGCAFFVVSLGLSLRRLSRIRRRAYPWPDRHSLVDTVAAEIGLRRRVLLALDDEVMTPITCGTRRPAVILPSDATTWSNADIRRALMHEMAHVRRNDWAMQLVARAACALYWFHPLVWKLWREFCLEAERACDDAVLSTADHADYADQLVKLARRMSAASTAMTLTMASRNDLSTRVSAILDDAQKRGPVGMLPIMTTATAALMMAFALAPLRAIETPRERESMRAAVPEQTTQITQTVPQPRARVSALDRALFEAAQSGDIAEITALLNAGANANAAIPGDGSPLMAAASGGHLAAVRFLLDRGVDPNLAVGGDGTALIVASRAGHAAVAALLLDRGADFEQVVPGDENALIQASGSGKIEGVRLLVSRGANVNARVWADRSYPTATGEWRSPLSMAKRGRHQAVVEYLISVGAIE